MNERKGLNNNEIVQNNVDSPLVVEKIRKCPECGSKNIITDYKRAEISCGDCGIIIAENIVDLGPEWRTFDSDQVKKRERAFPTTPFRADGGLGTPYIRIPGLKTHGKIQVGKRVPANQKTLARGYTEIKRICSNLKLPKTIEREAQEMCKNAQQNRLLLGPGGVDAVAAATVYISCSRQGFPRTYDEIAEKSHFDKKTIAKIAQKLKRELGIKTKSSSISDYIPRFCAQSGLSMETQRIALKIGYEIETRQDLSIINDKLRTEMAGVAIYISTMLMMEKRTLEQIANIADTTEQTLRKKIGEISPKLPMDLL
jgi:transcription initiation factor TFIIB